MLRLTVSQSDSMSRCQAHSETCDQMLLSVWRLLSESGCLVSVGRPLWREVGAVTCHSQSVVIYPERRVVVSVYRTCSENIDNILVWTHDVQLSIYHRIWSSFLRVGRFLFKTCRGCPHRPDEKNVSREVILKQQDDRSGHLISLQHYESCFNNRQDNSRCPKLW
jgi:hypothetical protein